MRGRFKCDDVKSSDPARVGRFSAFASVPPGTDQIDSAAIDANNRRKQTDNSQLCGEFSRSKVCV